MPLSTPAALQEEGKQQRNCVGVYATQVRRGKVYIYRVLEPERATLSIIIQNYEWCVSELKGRANCKVAPTTLLHVQKWLHWANVEANRPEWEQTLNE